MSSTAFFAVCIRVRSPHFPCRRTCRKPFYDSLLVSLIHLPYRNGAAVIVTLMGIGHVKVIFQRVPAIVLLGRNTGNAFAVLIYPTLKLCLFQSLQAGLERQWRLGVGRKSRAVRQSGIYNCGRQRNKKLCQACGFLATVAPVRRYRSP